MSLVAGAARWERDLATGEVRLVHRDGPHSRGWPPHRFAWRDEGTRVEVRLPRPTRPEGLLVRVPAGDVEVRRQSQAAGSATWETVTRLEVRAGETLELTLD